MHFSRRKATPHRPGSAWYESPRTPALLVGALGITEVAVGMTVSPALGIFMGGCTAGLVVVGKARERAIARSTRPLVNLDADEAADTHVDRDTGLPNRTQLIDQLTREIARSERYAHDMTIAVVHVDRLEDVEAAWGPDTANRAVMHVAETLRRVTRASDFLSRLDADCFAVVLMQCTGQQAQTFARRVDLAVTNRPVRSTERMRVPLYVTTTVTALQYDRAKFRGPLEFLSLAGAEPAPPRKDRRIQAPAATRANPHLHVEAPPQRRQPAHDYYPEGQMQDFADAYRQFRDRKTG